MALSLTVDSIIPALKMVLPIAIASLATGLCSLIFRRKRYSYFIGAWLIFILDLAYFYDIWFRFNCIPSNIASILVIFAFNTVILLPGIWLIRNNELKNSTSDYTALDRVTLNKTSKEEKEIIKLQQRHKDQRLESDNGSYQNLSWKDRRERRG